MMHMPNSLKRDFERALSSGGFEKTDNGIYLPGAKAFASGQYMDYVNGELIGVTDNMIVNEGFVDILNTVFNSTAKKAGFYVALYAGAVSPVATWTAASFPATASEITSEAEGYTTTNRPAWTTAATSGANTYIDNYASKAAFSIVTASTLNVNGAAIVTAQTRGSTSGVLVSAARYANTRQLQNGDAYEVGYRLSFSTV